MVTLLRLVSLVFLVSGLVGAVELLPDPGEGNNLAGAVFECAMRGAQGDLTAGDASAAGQCGGLLPSIYALLGGLLAALLVGGFASLLYNAKKTREIMERFDGNTAQE